MIVGIILAAGKGTRITSNGTNKTALDFSGKPMVSYALELFQHTVDKTVLVVGAYADSVRKAAAAYHPLISVQHKRLGTGHAVLVALRSMKKTGITPELVVVGYGDHMMFYTPNTVREMIAKHRARKAALTLVTVMHESPDTLAWGRVLRNSEGYVARVVEQKDATSQERAVRELNAGFYVFDFSFLTNYIGTLEKSSVSQEYYITDMIARAVDNGYKVLAFPVPFPEVGIGVNTWEQLNESQKLLERARSGQH